MLRRLGLLLLLGASSSLFAGPANLTIYAPTQSDRKGSGVDESDAGFALVRETLPLVLQQGDNDVAMPAVSPLLDPASVMLRDPTGKNDFHILLQQFRSDALTEEAMLARFEGQTIPFLIREGRRHTR